MHLEYLVQEIFRYQVSEKQFVAMHLIWQMNVELVAKLW